MATKLIKKVKLPKEEISDNENKGRDPKDEPSSTPDREGKAEAPELFAKSNERYIYEDEKAETI